MSHEAQEMPSLADKFTLPLEELRERVIKAAEAAGLPKEPISDEETIAEYRLEVNALKYRLAEARYMSGIIWMAENKMHDYHLAIKRGMVVPPGYPRYEEMLGVSRAKKAMERIQQTNNFVVGRPDGSMNILDTVTYDGTQVPILMPMGHGEPRVGADIYIAAAPVGYMTEQGDYREVQPPDYTVMNEHSGASRGVFRAIYLNCASLLHEELKS